MGRRYGRKALVAGAVLATLPDLDVVIDYGNPLAQMINHRGFSHSLFVLTAFALLLAWLARRFRLHKDGNDYGRLTLTLWLILITHPILDAFTSYGTQLWGPLRPTPGSSWECGLPHAGPSPGCWWWAPATCSHHWAPNIGPNSACTPC